MEDDGRSASGGRSRSARRRPEEAIAGVAQPRDDVARRRSASRRGRPETTLAVGWAAQNRSTPGTDAMRHSAVMSAAPRGRRACRRPGSATRPSRASGRRPRRGHRRSDRAGRRGRRRPRASSRCGEARRGRPGCAGTTSWTAGTMPSPARRIGTTRYSSSTTLAGTRAATGVSTSASVSGASRNAS